MRRRDFVKSGAAALAGTGPLAGLLAARGMDLKVGATDWNLRQEAKLGVVDLAKKIGFDGVEVSLGVGTDRLPLADADLQRQYREEARKHNLPIVSTCLNILHRNYLKNGEYQRASLNALMGQPYSRVIVLHLTMLFGGWIVMLLGSPLPALVLLVVIKTAADLRAHTAERRKFAPLTR